MKIFRNFLFFSLLLMLAASCGRKAELNGFWGVRVGFSPHETQHTGLILFDDSTFYYFSRPNVDMAWELNTGRWVVEASKIHLMADGRFSLWLKVIDGELEMLDFEGNEVLSGKKVKLARVTDASWTDEISLVMTGKLLFLKGKPYFLPCNKLQLIGLDSLSTQQKQLENQIITARFSFIPEALYFKKQAGIQLESVFGPAECR